MTYKHHTRLELVEGGNIFKQGDHPTLKFIAYDSLGNEVDLTNKQIDGALYSRNKGIVYEAPASFTDGRIVFTIDELVDNGKFQLEFTATDSADPDYRAKFPSDEYEAQLTIKPSKDNMDFVGVSMTTVAQLKNELQGLQTEFAGQVLPRVDIVEDKQTQLEADYQAAAGALTEDSEVILARKGEPTLRAFNDKVVAQLADKVGQGVKAEPEDLSDRTLELVTGGGTVNVLSEPQENSVTLEKLSPDMRTRFLGDFPAENVLLNGDFANGTTNWLAYNGTITTVSTELVYTVATLSALARFDQSRDIAISGHKYYVRGDILPKYANATRFQMGGADSANVAVTPNIWNKASAVVTASANTRFRFYHSTSSNYVAGDTVKFDNLMAVDLTATFGAGNEPTKEEFEEMLEGYSAGWFDGIVSPLINNRKLYEQTNEQAKRLQVTESKVNELTGLSKITPLTADPVEPPVGAMWFLVDYLESLHLSQTSISTNYSLMSKPTRIAAQKFTAAETINLTAFELNLRKTVASMADITVELWESNALSDTAPATLIETVTIINSEFDNTTDFKWIKKRVSSQPQLTAGKTYWLLFSVGTDGHAIIGTGASNLIPNSAFAISTNGGTSFASTGSTIGLKLYKLEES